MYGKRYAYHPYTNEQIVGFKIPNWEAVIATVIEAAKEAPIAYIGWDVAIRDIDCVIIEANYRPMVNVVQIAGGGGKKRYLIVIYEKNKERNKNEKVDDSWRRTKSGPANPGCEEKGVLYLCMRLQFICPGSGICR